MVSLGKVKKKGRTRDSEGNLFGLRLRFNLSPTSIHHPEEFLHVTPTQQTKVTNPSSLWVVANIQREYF